MLTPPHNCPQPSSILLQITWPQGSLAALPTPAILVFLHSLPLVSALAGLSAWSGLAMSLGPLTVNAVLGAAPTAVIGGIQVRRRHELCCQIVERCLASRQQPSSAGCKAKRE